jgi:hypothetical protein
MSIRIRERPDSRQLHYGAQGGGETLRYNVITTAGESQAEVWLYVLSQTGPYLDGFIRNDLSVNPVGGPLWTADVEYGTTGVGGGDEPLGGAGSDGGTPPAPSDPAGDSDPLPNSWSFNISAPHVHLTQSLETLSSYLRGSADPPPDFAGKIGVGKDNKVEGCDIPPESAFKFSRSWARPNVTLEYYRRLAALAGCTNSTPIFGFEEGEVLFLSASGQGTEGDKWSISAEFGVSFNDVILSDGICPGLPESPATIAKPGFAYLWIYDTESKDGTTVVIQPGAAYVEKVLGTGDLNTIFEL